MDTCFYPTDEMLNTPTRKTPTEILWNSLRLIFDEMDDIKLIKHCPSALRPLLEKGLFLQGLYCLRVDGKIVSVAVIGKNTIQRIVTIPKFRGKGYARLLIDIITDKMKENGVPFVFAPVNPGVEGLFEGIGWVKCGRSVAKDGTTDYCPAEYLEIYGTGKNLPGWNAEKWFNHLQELNLRRQ